MFFVLMDFIHSRMERYIPGMALLSGFNQTSESNANQEVSASIVCASSDSIDVTIKLPKVWQEILTTYNYIYI